MEEEDFAFSLTRSDLIARRLYDLADLYETSHKLPEARVAYLMRISYRYGLASADDIDAKRQVVRKQIDDRLSKAAELKVKGDLAQAEAEEQAANERRSAQRQLLNYDHDGAKRLLARAVRDLGYLEGGLPHEGEASREQASAEQLFRSCATLLAGLADRESARPVNQREMSNCYAGLAWVERQRSATCNNKYVSEKIRAEGCSNQLEFLTSARDAYLKSIEYLERAFKQAASGETSDLTATLARVASLVEEMQRLQPTANDPDDRKKAIAEAATYRERAMGVAWTAYSACQSASVDHQCRNSGIVKDLAIRRNGYAWNLIRLGRIDEARGFLESAIQLNKEDPLKPRDFDELAAAINLAHTLLFNGEFERAKEIYLAVKDVSFNEPGLNNPSGFGNIKADFAEFKELGTVHPAMCRIGKLINDPEYAATTCAPR
jgi:tetratricopeptide (TPR) repeat protein